MDEIGDKHTATQAGVPVDEEPKKVDGLQTEVAFVLYQDPAGHWIADDDITKVIISQRRANFNDFYHAACSVKKDVESSETANRVIQMQEQLGKQMAERMQAAQVAKNIGGPIGQGIDLSKLRG